MRLTQWTDYSLRVLMYCAATQNREAAPTVGEIAESHAISTSHVMKIVMMLGRAGYLETTRGRGGGIRLQRPADQIRIGDVVRQTETDLRVVECFDSDHNACRLDGGCRLKFALQTATDRFLEALDAVTLAELVGHPRSPGLPQLLTRLPARAAETAEAES